MPPRLPRPMKQHGKARQKQGRSRGAPAPGRLVSPLRLAPPLHAGAAASPSFQGPNSTISFRPAPRKSCNQSLFLPLYKRPKPVLFLLRVSIGASKTQTQQHQHKRSSALPGRHSRSEAIRIIGSCFYPQLVRHIQTQLPRQRT